MSEGDSSFFSRWSRRKAETRVGAVAPGPAAGPSVAVKPEAAPATLPPAPPAAPWEPPAPPPPTLADVEALTTQSDYTRFVSRDVSPEVKQAALKKLFADPHFNVMDGLDTYIDDYGQPDPLPPGMLRKMMQSQMLGLFDHEKKAEGADASPGPVETSAPAAVLGPPPPADTAAPDAGEEPAAVAAPSTIPTRPEP